MNEISLSNTGVKVGESFLTALASRDFEQMKALFHNQIHFRALVPSAIREGNTPDEAIVWLRHWFEEADELEMLRSSIDHLADRLYIGYRVRVRSGFDWELVEQQVYCVVNDGLITKMSLVCSGFRPDLEMQQVTDRCAVNIEMPQSTFGANAFYDAGSRGCADGPLDEIAGIMRGLVSGQTLEVRAADPSVARDLPAWCRLVGHPLVKQEQDRFLIRHQ